MKFTCIGTDGRPIRGSVVFATAAGHTACALDANGQADFPGADEGEVRSAVVSPADGHWCQTVSDPRANSVCRCMPIAGADTVPWWMRLVGKHSIAPDHGRGIRLGVVDIGFDPPALLEHVRVVDVENQPLTSFSLTVPSHGETVCKILGERGDAPGHQGLVPAAEITLVDAALREDDPTHLDEPKIGAAIELLVDEYKSDLINISGGSYLQPRLSLENSPMLKAVRHARDLGALCICATGNTCQKGVAIPARFADAIGVGAIGETGVAPAGTIYDLYRAAAEATPGASGELAGTQGVFHYVDTSWGVGLDVVAPGLGVVLQFEGGLVGEYMGTSFASPIVTGLLAHRLSGDEQMSTVSGPARSRYIEQALYSLCVDLKMARERQGAGMPRLQGGEASRAEPRIA